MFGVFSVLFFILIFLIHVALARYLQVSTFRQQVHTWDPSVLRPEMSDDNVKLPRGIAALAKEIHFMPALCNELLENDDVDASSSMLATNFLAGE